MAEESEEWEQAKREFKGRKIEFYERRSEFDRHDGSVAGKFKLVLNVITPAKNILEVGCGDGSFLKIVSTSLSPKMACGLDISKRAVQTAKSSGAEVILCDVDNGLPIKNECFNLGCTPFYHLQNCASTQRSILHLLQYCLLMEQRILF